MKKELFFLLLVISAVACNNNATDQDKPATTDSTTNKPAVNTDTPKAYIHIFKDTTLEDKITAALLKLPLERENQIRRLLNSIDTNNKALKFFQDYFN